MADIISPFPGCSKRKSGKSISVKQQQIILNVAKYFQEESKSGNKPQFSKLAFWVDWKMADIISPLPGCSKRKSGKSISVEEQQIILNVAKYFQEESKSGNKPQFKAGAVIAKTAAATGVSKNSVRKIVSAGKVIDEGKTREAKVRFGKLDNFDVGVIRRIIHNLYWQNIPPSLKKIQFQLEEKMNFP